MTRHTALHVFPFIVLLAGLTACQPRKAIALKDTIHRQERAIFNILVGKSGLESKKLELLIKHDYDAALAVVNDQAQAFDKAIDSIATLPTEGIKQGNELKNATVDYYEAVKELQLFDRQMIENRQISDTAKGDVLQAAQDKDLSLSRQKQELYKKVHEKEIVYSAALERFNTANGI